mgnify:CR=1 FL=1
MRHIVAITAMAAILCSGAASAAEYECRNRDGTFAGNPESMKQAKEWEDRRRGLECFRKGVPIKSERDSFVEQKRAERTQTQYASRHVDECMRKVPRGFEPLAAWQSKGRNHVVVVGRGTEEIECLLSLDGSLIRTTRR